MTARAGFILGAVALVVRACISNGAVTPDSGVAAVVVLGIGLLGVELYRRNRRVSKSADLLTVRNMFGLKHRILINNIDAAYFAPHYFNTNNVDASRLVLRDADSRMLLRLDSGLWNGAEIAALAHELPGVTALPSELTGKQLVRQFPQVASYQERHPWRVGGIWLAGAVVFAIVLVSILTALPE